MKRSLTSTLCLILFVLPILCFITLPPASSAETGAQTSSEEAQEYQPVVISGNGNASMIIQVDFSPSRVTLQGKNTLIEIEKGDLGAAFLSTVQHYQDSWMTTMWPKGTLMASIKAGGDWTLTIEHIKRGGALPISGKGTFISDIIELTEPLEIIFIADGTKLNGVSTVAAQMEYPLTEEGYYSQPDYITWDERTTTDKPRIETEFTLNPEGQSKEGVLFVICRPEVEWRILVDGLPAPMAYSELTIGSSGQEVLDMKGRFYQLGYFRTGNYNDRFTDSTADTVRLFEKNNGLPVDGVADVGMLGVLYSDSAVEK